MKRCKPKLKSPYRHPRFSSTKILTKSVATTRCDRTFLWLGTRAILIVDHVATPHPALVEARLIKPDEVSMQESSVLITGEKEKLQVAIASSRPIILQGTKTLMSWPKSPPHTMLRLGLFDFATDVVFATSIRVQTADGKREISLTALDAAK